jgi:hypothetical protein
MHRDCLIALIVAATSCRNFIAMVTSVEPRIQSAE